MKTVTLLVGSIVLAASLASAQEMSAEWHRQKKASLSQTKRDFPQSANPGPFRKRMFEINEWARINDRNLYYDPNKDYLIARMVQLEFEEAAEQQQRLPQQTSTRSTQQTEGAPSPSRSIVQPAGFEATSNRTADRSGAIIIVLLGLTVAGLGFWTLHPKPDVKSAVASGRRAAAWILLPGTVGLVTGFFLKFDGYGPSIAIWLTLVPFLTMVAFLIGWIIGIFRYQKDKSREPGDSTVNESIQKQSE